MKKKIINYLFIYSKIKLNNKKKMANIPITKTDSFFFLKINFQNKRIYECVCGLTFMKKKIKFRNFFSQKE